MIVRIFLEPWLEKYVRQNFCQGKPSVKVDLNSPLGRIFRNSQRDIKQAFITKKHVRETVYLDFELSQRIGEPDQELIKQFFLDYFKSNMLFFKEVLELGPQGFQDMYQTHISRQGSQNRKSSFGHVGLKKVCHAFLQFFRISEAEFPWNIIRGIYKREAYQRNL